MILPALLAQVKDTEVHTVAVIDNTGKYFRLFKDTDTYHFVGSDKSLDEYRKQQDKSLTAILSITGDLLTDAKNAALYSDRQIAPELRNIVNDVLSDALKTEKIASFNIPNLEKIIEESDVDFSVTTIKWDESGNETSSSGLINMIIGFALTFLIYMFVIMYGSMVMSGVLEEKTQRIVELMVSSVRPFDLMMGKIIGIALVGLTQLFIWGIMAVAIFFGGVMFMAGNIDPQTITAGAMQMQGVNMSSFDTVISQNEMLNALYHIDYALIGISFILYFMGGYLLYASVFAAVGASVDQQEDATQFITPIMLVIILGFVVGMSSIENPNGPLAFWGSIIPLTSPVVMMMRLPYDVPLWQLAVSIVLLFATAFALTWFSAKIYRTGILMYGKKPGAKEMLKWLRYK
jgi:ABC-2 type transport system permease protein